MGGVRGTTSGAGRASKGRDRIVDAEIRFPTLSCLITPLGPLRLSHDLPTISLSLTRGSDILHSTWYEYTTGTRFQPRSL